MANILNFLYGRLADLSSKTLSKGKIYFAVDEDKDKAGKIFFDDPETNQRIDMTPTLVYVGTEEPEDPNVEIWIDTDDDGEGTFGLEYGAALSLVDGNKTLVLKNKNDDDISAVDLKKVAPAVTVTLLAAGWASGSTGYTQTINVTNMTADWIPGFPLKHTNSDAATDKEEAKAFGCLNQITSNSDSLTFTCFDKVPEVTFTIDVPEVIGRGTTSL